MDKSNADLRKTNVRLKETVNQVSNWFFWTINSLSTNPMPVILGLLTNVIPAVSIDQELHDWSYLDLHHSWHCCLPLRASVHLFIDYFAFVLACTSDLFQSVSFFSDAAYSINESHWFRHHLFRNNMFQDSRGKWLTFSMALCKLPVIFVKQRWHWPCDFRSANF